MTLSPEHESQNRLFCYLIMILAEEMNLAIRDFGSTTSNDAKMAVTRGLEPDSSFYIANQARMRGVLRMDPTIHPPPDLVLEIDVTRRSINRLEMYGALGVPEVWRFDGEPFCLLSIDAMTWSVMIQVERKPAELSLYGPAE